MKNPALQYWFNIAASVCAALALVLVIADGVLLLTNRQTQTVVNARAQYINQTVQLSNVSQAMIRAAANAAVANNDTKLGEVLTANGVRYQETGTPSAPPAAAPAPPATATGARRPANAPAVAQPGRAANAPATGPATPPAKGP